MFDNKNPYTVRKELVEGIMYYYVCFIDGQAIHRETEVSRPVYLEFQRFVKTERNLKSWDERHREYSELTDETLHIRAFYPQKSVEEVTLDNLQDERLRLVVDGLTETQRRRFILHYEFGLTYEQISKMEDCTFQAVAKTIKAAKTTIKKFFEI